MSTEDCLGVLSNGFIKGAVGFLKSGGSELRAISSISPIREVRVGITQVREQLSKCCKTALSVFTLTVH